MRTINYIAVHCTASPQGWGVKELQQVFKQRGFQRPGYHYVITADGVVHPMQPEELISNGVKGYNSEKGVDNRTDAQRVSLRKLLGELRSRYPKAKIQGHRDFSPDTNGNGIVDPWERIKECPCFDAIPEYKDL